MYKMIVIDLDGTLLNDDKIITKYTLDVLKSIKDKCKIVLASARGYYRIIDYVKELDIENDDQYTIAFNGGMVLKNNGDIISKYNIDVSKLETIYSFVKNNKNYKWMIYTANKTVNLNDIDNFDDFIKKNDIYKIVMVGNENNILQERSNVKYMENIFEITSSESTRIEFVQKGISKIEAIKRVAEILNVDKESIIAIGDGENDIKMLQYCGCGIAMGNASDEVKIEADLIAESNNNDGVGYIIEEMMNL